MSSPDPSTSGPAPDSPSNAPDAAATEPARDSASTPPAAAHSSSAPSSGATPAAQEQQPQQQPEPTQPPQQQQQEQAEEQQRGSRIRIGTQRYGSPPPRAVAHPVLPAPPPELLAKAAALSASGGTAPADTANTTAPDAGGAATGSSSEPRRTAQTPRPRKGPKKHDRSQSLNEQPPRSYPPPNIRGQLTPDLEMEYLAALGGESLEEIIASDTGNVVAELEPESRHQAKVVSVHRDDVFVEIAGHLQGAIKLGSFAAAPEPGTVIEVAVSRFNAVEGIYELTLPGAAVDVGDWSEVAEGMVVEARVTGHNKGGLECEVSQLRGFIPASQVSLYRVEDLSQCVGEALTCIITEANPQKRNLVLSRRAVMEREQAEAKEKLLASLEVGQILEGTVRSLRDFGAFVDIGGVDALLHISQLSWDRVKHPSEVLELGQKVRVKIHKIDPDTGKIGLAYRDLTESPWATAAADYPVKSRATGRVTRLTDFGAFVRLGPGVEGLVHISELSHKRVFRVSDVLAEGQEIEVLVLSVDPEAQRISLSLKALEAKPVPARGKADEPDEPETPPPPPKKRKTPLRGGIGGPPTGDQFGLKW